MKKIQRKYNIGGLVHSYASPQIVEGIGSVTSQFAKGGMVKLVGKDEGNYYYRRFNDAIGSFAWQIDKRYNEAILFPLDSFDIDYYSFIPLKDGEVLFRYETDSIKGIMKPIIKINVNKALVYFNDSEASARDEVRFETRGVKADYIVLEEGYDKKFAKGGKLGFDGLAKKVAKNYEGKKVPKKYQNEYGKVYSKEEAKEVGFKVANKVKIMKGGKFAEGGEVMVKDSYEVGDKIRFKDKFRNEEHDGTIYEINERGTYIVSYGSGITAGTRGVQRDEVVGVYPKVEVKKKRFGFFGAGGKAESTSLNNLKKELALHKRQKRELTAKKIRPVTIIGKGDHKPVQARGLAFAELDRRIQETQDKINAIQNKFAEGGVADKSNFRGIDLFEDYDLQEPKLRSITKKIDKAYDEDRINTKFLQSRLDEVEAIGYTFEIDMDGSAYGLRPKSIDISELEGYEEFAKGGLAKVEIVNEGEVFDDNKYSAILGDFDLDGLPNVDDLEPLNENNKSQIEQLKFSKTFKELLETKKDLDIDMNKFVNKLRQNAPKESKIYARTKTPFSILNKLVSSRLLNEKHGLKDLVGTTIAFDNLQDLNAFKNKVVAGKYGKVLDFDDFYEDPKDGYRAYHFIIEQAGVPIELQLKTERMKNINVLSHDAYKNKRLNSEYMNYLTNLAKDSDEGNKFASKEFDQIMKDKVKVQQMLTL